MALTDNKVVAKFTQTGGTPPKVVKFFRYDGDEFVDLRKEFREVEQPGVLGARNILVDTMPLTFDIEVMGSSDTGSPASGGIYSDLLSLRGELGTLLVRGKTITNVRVLEATRIRGEGPILAGSPPGGSPVTTTWQFDVVTVQFAKEI